MSSVARKSLSFPASMPRPTPVPNRRILVVDDEKQIADSIRQILAPTDRGAGKPRSSRSQKQESNVVQLNTPGFDVVVVHNSKDALAAIQDSLSQDRPFALGFFDVLLGEDKDGIELVKENQALDPRIYSVFVTAYHDRTVDSISQFLGEENLDLWDYINKPFTEGEILQKARHLSSLWDLHRLKEWQEDRLADAQKRLLQHERQNTIAAIGRSFAHEFGNLLTHIVGNADIALKKNDPARMKQALEVILRASEAASALLRKFTKFEDPSGSPRKPNPINMQIPIEEAQELMAFQFRKSKIEFVKERFAPVLLEADKHSLVQVFMNLFINSTHAMNGSGKIYVQLYKAENSTVKVLVRDTGSGIPEHLLEKVTDPMFTTKGDKGSGLGLSICKEIIEIEHGGEFKISNHPQGGVVVEITLPEKQEVADDDSN